MFILINLVKIRKSVMKFKFIKKIREFTIYTIYIIWNKSFKIIERIVNGWRENIIMKMTEKIWKCFFATSSSYLWQ